LKELRLAFCGSAVSDASLEGVALHLSELEGLSVRGCVRVTGKGVENILRGCSRLEWVDASQCRNLEPWLRTGGVDRWGYDDRAGRAAAEKALPHTMQQPAAGLCTGEDAKLHRTMSVTMLTTPSFRPHMGSFLGFRGRQPVRFIVEKGTDGLR
jgi:F-box/leucine-rich repeat protein 7